MRIRFGNTLVLIGMLHATANALELGHIGLTYPIVEEDALISLHRKLQQLDQSGELAAHQRQAQEKIVRSIESPQPIAGLSTANQRATYYVDPTLTFDEAIKDHTGRIIIAAGTKINPLAHIRLSKRLVFFDGRDALQAEKVKQMVVTYKEAIKPILVGGSFMQTMRTWGKPVYFDQYGKLVKRFQITAVPAIVSQDTEIATRLKVEMIPAEELQ